GTADALGPFGDTAFETARLNHNIFGKKARQSCTTGTIPNAKRSQRILSQHAAPGDDGEKAQIGCSTSECRVGGILRDQPSCRALEAFYGFTKSRCRFAEARRIDGPN